jgi:heparan-alpha-glucosaminide N-acetyltransferase
LPSASSNCLRALDPDGDTVATPASSAVAARLASIDAYRGFVMLLMMGEVLRLCAVAAAQPASALWGFLCHHQDHVAWVGGSLHDLIQPSFSFLVGVALPFSLAGRLAAGQPRGRMVGHAFRRALILVLLGIWLRSIGKTETNFTFEDTLTQIGLGYGVLFLLALRPARDQWLALALILLGYWAAFAAYPLPGPGFDYPAVGVPPEWPHHLSGFAAHWNKNNNLAWAFDVWFLNLFPRESPFLFNDGGYATLSFIPTLGTMILGLLAGNLLRSDRAPQAQVRLLAGSGLVLLVLGWLLGVLGICPVVKRIWTPSFTLWSGGLCLLFLAAFYQLVDLYGHRRWSFPLVVIGMNSIAAYMLAHLWPAFLEEDLNTHLGGGLFRAFGEAEAPLLQGAVVLLVLWLALLWMYRRRIFLRI